MSEWIGGTYLEDEAREWFVSRKDYDALQAENERLREALERVARLGLPVLGGSITRIAREALGSTDSLADVPDCEHPDGPGCPNATPDGPCCQVR